MAYSEFMTDTATMKKITTDGAGDPTVAESFAVDIDPDFGYKRINDSDGEEITGRTTIIGPHDSIDITHENWELAYRGRDWQIEQIDPSNRIGTNEVTHYEVVLR